MFSLQVEKKLELRLHSLRYAGELSNLIKENHEHLIKWLPWANKDYSVENAREFIENNRLLFAEKEIPRFFIFENDRLIGLIGLNNFDELNRSIEVGYWLDKKRTGRGIITKCCRRVIDLVFSELNINRIIIRCDLENLKSRAIPVRLGFTREGVERQSKFMFGKFEDLIVYSILKEEWE